MKTAIIYYSKHHENTKKLLDAMEKDSSDEITLIDWCGKAGIYKGCP